jgi:hypothetical protein
MSGTIGLRFLGVMDHVIPFHSPFLLLLLPASESIDPATHHIDQRPDIIAIRTSPPAKKPAA